MSENVRIERQWKKAELNKIQTKLAFEREMEKKLDKELERILGRAVSMADLELLYQQDLKLLNQIEAGINNKIQSFKQIIATIWV